MHPRSYETADFIYNPLHYLALLEQKTKALDQAAPLDNWRLADCVHRLRRLMEARMGTAGRREFIQVLRLMEDFHQHQVEQAVSEALRLGAISFDAVKMLLLARLENRPARLDLTFYPYLPATTVGTTDPRAYLGLITNSAVYGSSNTPNRQRRAATTAASSRRYGRRAPSSAPTRCSSTRRSPGRSSPTWLEREEPRGADLRRGVRRAARRRGDAGRKRFIAWHEPGRRAPGDRTLEELIARRRHRRPRAARRSQGKAS